MTKDPCSYLLASAPNGVLYAGVTSDIWGRMGEHKQGLFPGFTKRYGIKTLVWYEFHDSMEQAIRREKQIKEWRRAWKVRLIMTKNPQWLDLFNDATNALLDFPADLTLLKR
jgi:putative endonuclease